MAKQPKITEKIQERMSGEWEIKVQATPFIAEKGAKIPSFGYPCAACGSENTMIRFAESTEEEESQLKWMELECKDCRNYTHYTRK